MKEKTFGEILRGALVRLGIILLAAMACVSSYSWFAKNQELQHTGIRLALQADNAVAEYRVFKYNTKKATGTEYADAENGDIGTDLITIDSIVLNQYDSIFKQRNRYTPAFIQIKLTQSGETPPAEGSINISITCDPIDHKDANASEGTPKVDYCSKVLRFSAMLDQVKAGTVNSNVTVADTAAYEDQTAAELYIAIDTKMYDKVKTYQCEVENEKVNDMEDEKDEDGKTVSFASQTFYKTISKTDDKYTLVKKDNCTINLSLNYNETDWAPAKDEEGNDVHVIFLYVYMTYDDGLVEIYKEQNDMKLLSVGENSITLENNLKQIEVSFGN